MTIRILSKWILPMLIFGLAITANAQEKILTRYTDSINRPVSRQDAFYKVIEYYADSSVTKFDQTTIYMASGKKKSEVQYVFKKGVEKTADHKEYGTNGNLRLKFQRLNGQTEGTEQDYDSLGVLQRRNEYVDGTMISTQRVDGQVITDKDSLSSYAEYPGGRARLNSFLATNIRLPEDAYEKKISGRVLASFIVDKDGEVKNCVIIESLFPSCDREVLRVIYKMERWKPALQYGIAVKSEYRLPVSFKIQ